MYLWCGKEIEDAFKDNGNHDRVDSVHLHPLAAHGVGAQQQVKIKSPSQLCPVTL